MKRCLSLILLLFSNSSFALEVTMTPSMDQMVSVNKPKNFSCSTSEAKGTITYSWSFENGQPPTSTKQNPGAVVFEKAAQGKANVCKVTATDTKDGTVCGTGSKSITVTVPSITITSIDVGKDEIKFDILPENLLSGTIKITVKGPSDVEMVNEQLGGGKNKIAHFDWSRFPQTAGQEFHATKIEILWEKDGVVAKDSQKIDFTGYGVFRISRYVTPDDDQWDGPTENVSFNANGDPPYRSVHSSWITRVRTQEGIGMSAGHLYKIRSVKKEMAPVRNYLIETEEGAYAARLTVNFSLAKHESDSRFRAHDKIVLNSDKGHYFSIDDTGNWSGTYNHLDRYAGVVGPSDANTDFNLSYVVKVK